MYNTWHEYGFGFCVDDIKTTPDKVLLLASLDKDILEEVEQCLENSGLACDIACDIDIFDELQDCGDAVGLSYILANMIKEFDVLCASDFDGRRYILYAPSYPWERDERDIDLTPQKISDIFNRYIRILTDDPIIIDYRSVENGG